MAVTKGSMALLLGSAAFVQNVAHVSSEITLGLDSSCATSYSEGTDYFLDFKLETDDSYTVAGEVEVQP